ncbi:MAG: hypothetical protein IKQ06_07295 [Bacilli bacterium]|nr:hypothetical protein [Clostridia bacterium]MBR6137940.1 hypothetical protein [Bacilli bacterium]
MVVCKKCNVKINTAVNKCPLCHNVLEEDPSFGDFKSNVFPYVESSKSNGVWKKILSIVFLTAIVICTIVDLFVNHGITWSIYVDAGVICISASIILGLMRKYSLSGILFYEFIFICIACYIWDRITGMNNWSLDYVIPSLSIIYIVANFVLRLVFKREFLRYIRNMFVASIVGIICLLLYIYKISNIYIISLISCIMGVFTILCMLALDGKRVFNELGKRLHI